MQSLFHSFSIRLCRRWYLGLIPESELRPPQLIFTEGQAKEYQDLCYRNLGQVRSIWHLESRFSSLCRQTWETNCPRRILFERACFFSCELSTGWGKSWSLLLKKCHREEYIRKWYRGQLWKGGHLDSWGKGERNIFIVSPVCLLIILNCLLSNQINGVNNEWLGKIKIKIKNWGDLPVTFLWVGDWTS